MPKGRTEQELDIALHAIKQAYEDIWGIPLDDAVLFHLLAGRSEELRNRFITRYCSTLTESELVRAMKKIVANAEEKDKAAKEERVAAVIREPYGKDETSEGASKRGAEGSRGAKGRSKASTRTSSL